jgi:eukaryotic-like serine/threonine-protein kinase
MRSTARRTWTPPPIFDGFEISHVLGTGGMASVYLAHDLQLDRPVALKVLPAHTRDPRAAERFVIEARALARIQHGNVIAAYRSGEVDGHVYLALELVDGPRVDQLERPLSWPRAAQIVLGLARGLAATHARGILHRDIKPANVMLTTDGEVKLIDFGLATATGLAVPRDPHVVIAPAPVHVTADGDVVGTPLYMAPELWLGEPATERSELYALGLVAYELLTGPLPCAHLRKRTLARALRRRDLPPLASRVHGAPAALTSLIDRCVERDAGRRPDAVAEVRDLLAAIVAPHWPARAAHDEAVTDVLDSMPTERSPITRLGPGPHPLPGE